MWRLSIWAAPASFDRAMLRARVPAYFAPELPIVCPTFAVRPIRPAGMESSPRAISPLLYISPSLHCGTVMAQGRPTLKVEQRAAEGSRATRRLRREGFIPGVVYGGGEDCLPFRADGHDLD